MLLTLAHPLDVGRFLNVFFVVFFFVVVVVVFVLAFSVKAFYVIMASAISII